MKIARVETFAVPPRWLLCRVETDDGVVGWGEPVVEGRASTVRTAVHELAELLVGRDPMRIEDHWQTMAKASFYRGGPVLSSAVAGLDQALWDIAGQVLGVPVHVMLGGPVRDRVRCYGWVGGDEPGQIAEAVAERVEAGFTAVKMNAAGRTDPLSTPRAVAEIVRRAEAARAALGPDRDFAVDFHGRFTTANARRVVEHLAPLHPLFVEEPVLPEHTHRIGDVVAATTVPIATGERLFSRAEMLPALQAGIAVLQPDLSHAGGISEVRRIAALAETFDVLLAPHCPLGPVALAAGMQIACCVPNFLIQEQSIGIHYNRGAEVLDYLVDPEVFTVADGYLPRPLRPGLGITVDERAVRAADGSVPDWRGPVWRHPDGSFAEW
ncbi:galactonate dehydratase [Thermobifida cellulosilytica]|uniref:Galactonate dehydratase n=1 Tax=Thermobifida cellulosilytica TB100 TaxID=665004 RepID=A0A147KFB4_THECS|nr:galactonate dehydratase [Thermobifida cellulosilytica]KUP95982.1 galactonate dehydratase [Thermobifida cellulosilytica TB100]